MNYTSQTTQFSITEKDYKVGKVKVRLKSKTEDNNLDQRTYCVYESGKIVGEMCVHDRQGGWPAGKRVGDPHNSIWFNFKNESRIFAAFDDKKNPFPFSNFVVTEWAIKALVRAKINKKLEEIIKNINQIASNSVRACRSFEVNITNY